MDVQTSSLSSQTTGSELRQTTLDHTPSSPTSSAPTPQSPTPLLGTSAADDTEAVSEQSKTLSWRLTVFLTSYQIRPGKEPIFPPQAYRRQFQTGSGYHLLHQGGTYNSCRQVTKTSKMWRHWREGQSKRLLSRLWQACCFRSLWSQFPDMS